MGWEGIRIFLLQPEISLLSSLSPAWEDFPTPLPLRFLTQGSVQNPYCRDTSVLLISGPMGAFALPWAWWVHCGVWVR